MSTFNVEFLGVQDAADRLSLTTARIRQMLISGILHGKKISARAWVIPSSEVDRLDRERAAKKKLRDSV